MSSRGDFTNEAKPPVVHVLLCQKMSFHQADVAPDPLAKSPRLRTLPSCDVAILAALVRETVPFIKVGP